MHTLAVLGGLLCLLGALPQPARANMFGDASNNGKVAGSASITSATEPECTRASGTSMDNTAWTLDGSPYHVDSNLEIAPKITLTIQPSVHILLPHDVTLGVGGTLVALGNTQPISF